MHMIHRRRNSSKHNRRSIRLKEYDYSQAGAYFITKCWGTMHSAPTESSPKHEQTLKP
jgi:hypothetical protein